MSLVAALVRIRLRTRWRGILGAAALLGIAGGLSMFALSWIGMRGMPPNPQSKMMSYIMPVMFTVLFWNFASGLNLYYAVQNLAALPQQWMLARERTTKKDIAKSPGGAKGAPGG